MVIQIDTREKAKAIKNIVGYFDKHGIEHFSSKLYVGDYMSLDNPRLIVDRKQNLSEVYSNLCQGHARFRAEAERARSLGIQLVILVEHGGTIRAIDDVKNWKNPRLQVSPYAWDGSRLYRTMKTFSERYGVVWEFCDKRSTGRKIVEILNGGSNIDKTGQTTPV